MPSCSEDRDAFKATSSARDETITEAESNRDLGPGSWLDKTWDGELKGRGCPDPGPERPGRCGRVCSTLKVSLKKKRKKKKAVLEAKTASRDNEADSRLFSTIFEKCGHN